MSDMNLDEWGQPRAVDLDSRRGDRITEIFAWVCIDPADDNEGILGAIGPLGTYPMIGADRNRIEGFRQNVQHIATAGGLEVSLVRFQRMETIETLSP